MPINLAERELAGQCREEAAYPQKRIRPNYFGIGWKKRPKPHTPQSFGFDP